MDKQESRPGKTVLEIKSLTVKNSKKVDALKGFSLDLHAGEIVGIAGVDGNGQSELIEAITGLREAESGTVSLNGKTLNGLSVRQRNESGIGHIPEDRQKRGLVLDYTIEENLILEVYNRPPYSRTSAASAIRKHAEHIIQSFDVRSGTGGRSIVRSMSGGNQQKRSSAAR